MTEELNRQIEQHRAYGHEICARIAGYLQKLGVNAEAAAAPNYEAAVFNLHTDPYAQTQDLIGYWYNAAQQRVGQIKFHSDGSCYAEYDILQPHPGKKHWFIEAINVWGRQDGLKVEAKLLEQPQ